MLFKSLSAAVFGIDAYLVEVEVDVGSGNLHDFNVVGLPDVAVKESRERIKAALKNCGYDFPAPQSVTINLAPADIRKEGSAFDLPMALGILGCVGTFFGKALNGFVFLGELSLDGGVRAVRGALSAALAARERGIRSLAVPEANAREAAVVEGIDVYALRSLPQAVDLINAPESFAPLRLDARALLAEAAQYLVDLRDVRGQQAAKRALEVACAGGHNIIFIGPPGEVSLGHHGVLFLDELPEFERNVLEVMRQPLEEGSVTIARAATSVTFPARFMLAAAMNPCPCGFFGDSTRECHCSPPQIQRYVSRISGPLLDRIDIHIEVPAVKYRELRGEHAIEESATVRERVLRARTRQLERFAEEKKIYANAQMPPKL